MEIDGILALISFAALVMVWVFAPSTKEAEKAVVAPAQQKALA
jgi:hypothetical protein